MSFHEVLGLQGPSPLYLWECQPSFKNIFKLYHPTAHNFFFDTISSRDNLQYPLIRFTSRYLNSLFVDFIRERVQLEGLSNNHTECQAAHQVARQVGRSHWNTLWCSKMGPRSISKHHGKRQNFKAATDAWGLTLHLMLGVGIALLPAPSPLGG